MCWFWSGSYIECNEIGEPVSTPALFAKAIMTKTTSLSLSHDEARCLYDAVLSVFPENVSDKDNAILSRLTKRLSKALDRLEDAPAAPTSQRVHLPKVEALLNELL